jgi:hypothetical protein
MALLLVSVSPTRLKLHSACIGPVFFENSFSDHDKKVFYQDEIRCI